MGNPFIATKARARAAFDRRTLARAGRVAILVCAFVLVSLAMIGAIYTAGETVYDPYLFAIGLGGMFAAACGTIALLFARNWMLQRKLHGLEERTEELADRNWELRDSEERTRGFLEAQGDVIVRRDRDGRISYANDAFCALAGLPRELIIGTTFTLPTVEEGESVALADGTRSIDQKIATSQGARWIAWREAVLRRPGDEQAETQSVGRDVTERADAGHALAEALDQAEAASRAKSRFLAMVSHEIRTPLGGILGMADLLRDTELTPEQTTYVQAVKTSGDTLLSLIEEILDFSKIEAGKLDLDARPFALTTLVEEVVELLAPRAQAKRLEIASYVDERLPERMVGDAARLRQVLLNLAGNAIKFTDKGGLAVIVEPGAQADEITFRVRDTGIGVAEDAQARIFGEFEQADSGPTRRFGGTGLGLAISQRIVERMGGRIAIDSRPGMGAIFHFSVTLPRAFDAASTSFAPPDLSGAAVLIVAPSLLEGPLVAERLRRWGAMTCLVPDEQVALALLPERRWDAILVDYALGAGAVNILAGAAAGTTRSIVLIKPDERRELAALKEAGFSGYLVKPLRAVSLAARLGREQDGFGRIALAPDADAGESSRADASARAAGLSILVAEDNDINALLARALLVKLGHRPVIAGNGAAAIEAWREAREAGAPHDLVLMDVHMPDLDGIAAAQHIRTAESEDGDTRTPIVALTANASADDREACLAAGMDGFLIKPLDRERLAAALELVPRAKASSLAA